MADSKLDQLVKGQPPPDIAPSQVAEAARGAGGHSRSITAPHPPSVVDSLPSSPPQIYLNLLILESSLRLQYLSLRARLRLHLLLLGLLTAWITTFTYLLFFRPREDGSGVGGSVYWVVESTEKLGWCGGVVTLCLFWGTGMYERGVRWPRKFVSTTNRGLRAFNLKVVAIRGSFIGEVISLLSLLDPLGFFREKRINFQIIPKDIEAGTSRDHWNAHVSRHGLVEEDLAPSGDVLKLLLLPKPFSPDFREGWDSYRSEYWDKENARRSELRKVVRARRKEVARREGGWLWWTGWRGWHNVRLFSSKTRRQLELEKLALRDKPSLDRLKERRRRTGSVRSDSTSQPGSRSSTPGAADLRRPGDERVRRVSLSAGSTRRPHKKQLSTASRLSATETILQGSDWPSAITEHSSNPKPLKQEDIDHGVKRERSVTPVFSEDIKQEPAEA